MNKYLFIASIILFSSRCLAVSTQQINDKLEENALRGFTITKSKQQYRANQAFQANTLKPISPSKTNSQLHETSQLYQQNYYGIPVIGGEVTIHSPVTSQKTLLKSRVNGQLMRNIKIAHATLQQLDYNAQKEQALTITTKRFLEHYTHVDWKISKNKIRLVLKTVNNKLQPVYEVRFYATSLKHTPVSYQAYVETHPPFKIMQAFNNINFYNNIGPGGNLKTNEYIYGHNNIPALNVAKSGDTCTLKNISENLFVVNMYEAPQDDTYYTYEKPYQYPCLSQIRDVKTFFGAFSPADDAYYFGHLVREVYKNWYHTDVLNNIPMILRVHAKEFFSDEEPYPNAYWDFENQTMTFGDGSPNFRSGLGLYPLVSIDITAHEMTHGFTAFNSNLAYHDESGSLNESFSDMAGAIAVNYMLKVVPSLYRAIYHKDTMVWSSGSTVIINSDPDLAVRYMDQPSKDGDSADCYHKTSETPDCKITYQDVVDKAKESSDDPLMQQLRTVHWGSGVYNHFFYILSTTPNWDVKKAFNVMVNANISHYWIPNTNLEQAACGVLSVSKKLNYSIFDVKHAFDRVGIATDQCD